MKRNALIACSFAALLAAAALFYHHAFRESSAEAVVEEQFAAANASASEGRLDEAIAGFQSLLDGGNHSASIYYNLANIQHRSGNLGHAILNYERALFLDPGSPDIVANLVRARKDAAAIEPEADAWGKFAGILSQFGWSNLGAVALLGLAAIAAVAALRSFRLPVKLVGTSATIAFLVMCTSAGALIIGYFHNVGRAIVLEPDTPLRVSPFDDAKAMATLPAGKTVRVLPKKTHESYQLVSLPSGQTGWLKHTETATITQK